MSPGEAKVLVGRVYWSASLGAARSWEGSGEGVAGWEQGAAPAGVGTAGRLVFSPGSLWPGDTSALNALKRVM